MRNYSNTAVETTLPLDINDSVTAFTVDGTEGWAPAPLTVILDPDQPDEEIILVTGYSGSSITSCERGWGGTAAVSHEAGARVRHGAVAEDFREASIAYEHLFGPPVYNPLDPTAPPTNDPLIEPTDIVIKSDDTWGALLPEGYESPIPQEEGA